MNPGSFPLAGQEFAQRFAITDSTRQKMRRYGLLTFGVGVVLTLSTSFALVYTNHSEVENAQVIQEKSTAAEERRPDPPPAPKPTFLVESDCDRPDMVGQIRYFSISPNQELDTGINVSIGDYIYFETDAPAGAVKFKFPGTYGASYYPIGRAGNLLFDTYKGKLLFTLEGAYAPGGFRVGVAILPRRTLPARVCFTLNNLRKNAVLLYGVGCSGEEVYWESLEPNQQTRWCIVPGRLYTVIRDVYSNELIKTIRDVPPNMEIQIRGVERDRINTAEPFPSANSERANRVTRVQRSESTESVRTESQETQPKKAEQEAATPKLEEAQRPQENQAMPKRTQGYYGHYSSVCKDRYHTLADGDVAGPTVCRSCWTESREGCGAAPSAVRRP